MKISPIKVNEIQLQFGVMKEILLDKKKNRMVCVMDTRLPCVGFLKITTHMHNRW